MDTVIEEIKSRVVSHYEHSREPLLLSSFGKRLRVEKIWPVEGETRGLLEVISSCQPELNVIRDPKAKAFAVVVAKGFEEIARKAIEARGESAFLENLPRPVVLAFVVKKPAEKSIFVKVKPPFRYYVAETSPDSDCILVDEQFRISDAFLDRIQDIEEPLKIAIANNIRQWTLKNSISLDIFYNKDNRQGEDQGRSQKVSHAYNAPVERTTALDRLRAAQPAGVAERMVVPLDIALALSRLP